MTEKWCEHVYQEKGLTYYNGWGVVGGNWKLCPICGAKKPVGPKKLWERLREKSVNFGLQPIESLASEAIDVVRRVIETMGPLEISPNSRRRILLRLEELR